MKLKHPSIIKPHEQTGFNPRINSYWLNLLKSNLLDFLKLMAARRVIHFFIPHTIVHKLGKDMARVSRCRGQVAVTADR